MVEIGEVRRGEARELCMRMEEAGGTGLCFAVHDGLRVQRWTAITPRVPEVKADAFSLCARAHPALVTLRTSRQLVMFPSQTHPEPQATCLADLMLCTTWTWHQSASIAQRTSAASINI